MIFMGEVIENVIAEIDDMIILCYAHFRLNIPGVPKTLHGMYKPQLATFL